MTPTDAATALPNTPHTPIVNNPTTPTPTNARVHPRKWAPAAALLIFALIVLPRLVLGPVGGDSGELQTAAATLGITHPPGYSTYVLIGWMATLVSFFGPATTITLLHTVLGATACVLLVRLMTVWGAAAVPALLAFCWFLCHRVVLNSFVLPEVYTPSLFLLLIVITALVVCAESPRWWLLILAAAAAGLLLANRPNALVLAPAILLLIFTTPVRTLFATHAVRRIALLALIGVVPTIVTFAYVAARDRSDVPYNYMAVNTYNEWTFEPGWYENAGRWDRMIWLLSAKQYHRSLAPSRGAVASQVRYVSEELGWPNPLFLAAILSLALFGLAVLLHRDWRIGAFAVLLLAGNLAFLLVYYQRGQPAMILSFLAFICVLLAIGLTALCAGLRLPHGGPWIAAALFAAGAWWTADADFLPSDFDDGTGQLIAALDFSELPDNAGILLDIDGPAAPVAYTLATRFDRNDVRVLTAATGTWKDIVQRESERAWWYSLEAEPPPGYQLVKRGRFWAVQPAEDDEPRSRPAATHPN